MKTKRETPIPKVKIKSIRELSELVKNKRTILIASIKNIPASQFQEIGKKLRGKAIIKVPKKNLIFKAIDSSGIEAVKKIKEQIGESVAILFSDLDCFELALELVKNKSPAKAKAGQLASGDIRIEAGATDLIPGPAVSELGALGIEIQIEKGKIHIKKPKTIVEEGEKISTSAADVMNKLDIKPFSIGLTPLCAFDTKEEKLYLNINIDKEGTLGKFKSSYGKALPFAVEIGYISKDTIGFLLQKAGMHKKALEKFGDKEEIINKESETEQKSNEQDNQKEEDSSDNNSNKSEPTGETNTPKENQEENN